MKDNIRGKYFSGLPWKEVLLGEGLLNIVLGVAVLISAKSLSPSTYNFFHDLSYEQSKSLLTLASKGILAFGFLNISASLLFVAAGNFMRKRDVVSSKKGVEIVD